ncbi:ABC transporter permease [Desulforhopalus singaporensis]|uniref:Spermidine/putrescine transport system permease protein n=1 Tax=Desulforhopalus singaporensis TaxID=91360 RepID=A0A1H0LKW8_9BACT|nr:ABC transporter permease [Desulforhopalus singaporensis]SDO68735.1 spermidine/putrescine transport system permease protein [Desulforhopalus singaporensis]
MSDHQDQRVSTYRKPFDWNRLVFNIFLVIVLFILLVPILIVIFSSFSGKDHLSWPFTDLTFRWYIEVLNRPLWVKTFINSLITAGLTTFFSLVLATPAAFALSKRTDKREVRFLSSFITWPIMMPPVILGIALLIFLSRIGLRGSYLAIAIGHTLWAAPLVFITMVAVFERFNPIYIMAAKDLGANDFQAFMKVTIPMVKSGIISAMFLAFVISTQEFIIALFLYSPSTITLPVELYTAIKDELSPGISAISVYMIGIVAVGLFVIDRVIGIENVGFSGKG